MRNYTKAGSFQLGFLTFFRQRLDIIPLENLNTQGARQHISMTATKKLKLLLFLALIGTALLSACQGSAGRALVTSQAQAPNGYVLAAEDERGFKWFIAPDSKAEITLDRRNPNTGKLETNDFTAVSVFIAWPHPNANKTQYSVKAFACGLLPGTYVEQSTDKRGWDGRHTTDAYGTPRWQVWQKVCKG